MPRTLNSWANIDRGARQAAADERRAAFDEYRMGEAVRAVQQRQTLNQLYAQHGGDIDAVAAAAPSAGLDAQTAMTLKERARTVQTQERKRALRDLDLVEAVADEAQNVRDQDSYSRWLAKAAEVARLTGSRIPNVPPTYDEQHFKGIREKARQAKAEAERTRRTLTPDEVAAAGYQQGSVVQEDEFSGQQTVVQKPPAYKAPTLKEVYDPGSPTGSRWMPAEQAAGMPGAPNAGAESPREQRVVDWMVESGIASNPQDAWARFTQAKTNPVAFASEMARAELPPLSTAAPDPVQLENRVRYWTDFARKLSGGGPSAAGGPQAGGTMDAPVDVTSAAEARNLPPGTYFRRPDGKVMRVPVR